MIRERIKKISDYLPLCEFFFKKPKKYEIDLKKHKVLIGKLYSALGGVKKWGADEIGEVIHDATEYLFGESQKK